jgi:hypothetical protein
MVIIFKNTIPGFLSVGICRRLILAACAVLFLSGLKAQEEKVVDLDEVVISATRTENPMRDVPVRINYLSTIQLKALPALNTDEYLQYLPGGCGKPAIRDLFQ